MVFTIFMVMSKITTRPKGRIVFFMRRGGGSENLLVGGTFFPEPKKGGHIFFQILILNFFLKRYAISEIRV